MPTHLFQRAAGALAGSALLRRGKAMFAENARDWNLPLSKLDKLKVGAWLILDDYAKGLFPPRFPDQQRTYQAERNYRFSIPGMTAADVARCGMSKPFWTGKTGRCYFNHFTQLTECLERLNVLPPAKMLELGCGSGWTAEFLAAMGYDVCGTTLSEEDVADANRRVASLEAKGLAPALRFRVSPMESVHDVVVRESFDAVFVYEALHHAFDWREALQASAACLKPGGWILICNEPNILHTCISYRVAKLSNTHEIGFSKGDLTAALRRTGFQNIISAGARLHCWFRPLWLLAQKQK